MRVWQCRWVSTTATPSRKSAQAQAHKVRRVRTEDLTYASRYQDVCDLCRRDHTDRVLVDLLEARQNRRTAPRKRAIQKVINKHGLALSLEDESRHHSHHRAPQPTSRPEPVKDSLEAVQKVLERRPVRQEIVEYIGRARKVSLDQVAEIFWPDAANPPQGPRYLAATELRDVLAPYHVVYRVWVGDSPRGYTQQVYGLGLAGAEWLSRATGRSWDWIPGPKNVGYKTLMHDLEVTDLFNALYLRSAPFSLPAGQVRLTLSISNYYAAHDLFLGLNGQERWFGNKGKRTISPDAFCAVGVDLPQPMDGIPQSSLNPLLIEYDTGTKKDIGEVADQLISHILLAQSRSLLKRFPQLDAAPDGYGVPMVVVFSHPTGRRDLAVTRIRKILAATREKFDQMQLQLRLPIWATFHTDWLKDQLLAPAYSLWGDDSQFEQEGGQTGFSRLMASNKALHQAVSLDSQALLLYNPDGGVWQGADKLAAAESRDAADRVATAIRDSLPQSGGEVR